MSFRCHCCDEWKTLGWGHTCNQCLETKKQNTALVNAVTKSSRTQADSPPAVGGDVEDDEQVAAQFAGEEPEIMPIFAYEYRDREILEIARELFFNGIVYVRLRSAKDIEARIAEKDREILHLKDIIVSDGVEADILSDLKLAHKDLEPKPEPKPGDWSHL